MRSITLLTLASAAVALSACSITVNDRPRDAVPPPPVAQAAPGPLDDPRLIATLFMQRSEEFKRLSEQSYALAKIKLPAALSAPGSAALEQGDGGAGKPPAAIFDVDETVLDNSPHMARAILKGEREFNLATWDQWVGERRATPMPGAVDFVAELRRNKVRVVFITNRECKPRPATPGDACPQHADTLANLKAAGFGEVAPADLMLKGQNGWPSDKASRRQEVAKTNRIVMSFGDQLSDMLTVTRQQGPDERAAIAARYKSLWETRWIVIPNPTYGAWYDSIKEPVTDALRVE
jgi:acid phosphatase